MTDQTTWPRRAGIRKTSIPTPTPTPMSEEEAARHRAAFKEREAKSHEACLARQAEWEREQREEKDRKQRERVECEAAERAKEKARKAAFEDARAREDRSSPFYLGGPKKDSPRDIRIALAKLYIDVWFDTATGVERIDGLDAHPWGSSVNKQSLGALRNELSDRWAGFKPPVGLLETVVRDKARATKMNGAVYWIDTPKIPNQDTRLDSWLIDGLGAVDSPLHRAASRAWMIDAIRCAHRPEMMPNLVLTIDGADPLHIAAILSGDYPPMQDFLTAKMLDGGKGRCRAARRLSIRCGAVDLAALKDNVEDRWREAAFYAAVGESVDLEGQIADANDAFERATNPFFAVLETLLSGVEGKIRVVDVVRALGLDADELTDNRDARHGAINRAMALLGFGHRRAVRWGGGVEKGWGRGACTASLTVEEAEDWGWRIKRA